MTVSKNVRTRFAPSPTGFLHVGGVRTALFAWLVTRQAGGQFILRIEDTDKVREVAGSEAHIIESLKWLGLTWDEGPDSGGPNGPYRQSQRLQIYKEWAQKLIDAGRAYADETTPADLDKLRAQAKAEKRPFLFREHRPNQPPAWDGNQPLRFKSDPKDYKWHDEVMGDLATGPEVVDDFIIIKSDGYPTYNFAHIVDDHLMGITHVIRSQEFVASIPKFLNLYDALGIVWPSFATLPYVMGPDGQKKLSKRDGAKDILDYRADGYLPDALTSFLATLAARPVTAGASEWLALERKNRSVQPTRQNILAALERALAPASYKFHRRLHLSPKNGYRFWRTTGRPVARESWRR